MTLFPLYLLTGMGAVGGLLWSLTRVTDRHRRLQAELTRLERLSAEVTMHAEAVLDRVDERIAELQRLAEAVQVPAVTHVAAPEPTPAPAEPQAASPAEPEEEPATPVSMDRYKHLQAQVLALSAQGMSEADIARELGVPRGEVQLMLRLRHRKAAGRVG